MTQFAAANGPNRRDLLLCTPPLLLLVEGNTKSRLQIANELLDEGYEVVEADNPAEAVSILKGRDDFDSMIADVCFGGLPADLTLIRSIASERQNTKVLIVSDVDEERSAITATGASFLKGPCARNALLRAVADMLRLPAPVQPGAVRPSIRGT